MLVSSFPVQCYVVMQLKYFLSDSGSARPFEANAIEQQLQVLSSNTIAVRPVTDAVGDLKAKAKYMMDHGMPKEEGAQFGKSSPNKTNLYCKREKPKSISYAKHGWRPKCRNHN